MRPPHAHPTIVMDQKVTDHLSSKRELGQMDCSVKRVECRMRQSSAVSATHNRPIPGDCEITRVA